MAGILIKDVTSGRRFVTGGAPVAVAEICARIMNMGDNEQLKKNVNDKMAKHENNRKLMLKLVLKQRHL